MTMVRDILMHMDRTYVTQKRKLPDSVRDRLRTFLLLSIERERHGELIYRDLIQNTLRMSVDLGVHSNAVYENDFESYFLDTTLDFYRAEAHVMLDVATCPEYLEKGDQRLNEEGARVVHYLNPSTVSKLKTIVETQLIKNQAKALVKMEHSGCVALFRDGKTQALRRMYSLFRRAPSTLPEISYCVLQYIKPTGEELVKTQLSPETALDASHFVEKLLALRENFVGFLSDWIIQRIFKYFVELLKGPSFCNDGVPRSCSLFRVIQGISSYCWVRDTWQKVQLHKVVLIYKTKIDWATLIRRALRWKNCG
ncbi:hypothetical protein PsorP6_011069 [Peronosclerospora sorghi]|uniref:Uncharacterized protein n=1 Tax=Peronosclerospora sorghi TaxID=230839 RepID=A0ACC0VV64_9STRA|nr:hypothetical protein PsorP6_011069 [Peronosclerospora sorghi]